MWVVVVVPACAPALIGGANDEPAQRSFGVTIGKVEDAAFVVAVGRPLIRFFGVNAGIEAAVGFAVTDDDHFGGTSDGGFFDFTDARNVDIAAHPELVWSGIAQAPIVVAIGEPGAAADAVRVKVAPGVGSTEGVIDRHIGVPLGIDVCGGAPEGFSVVAHVAEDANGPDVVKVGVEPEAAGVVAGVCSVHSVGDANLAEVIEAGGLFGFVFCLGEGGQEHGCEDGNDGDDDEQFDEGETGGSPVFLHIWQA